MTKFFLNVYFEEIRVFIADDLSVLNTLAWNNEIGFWHYFVGLRAETMINRDSLGIFVFHCQR